MEMVQSAYVGSNAEVFPKILDVHVEDGSTIADITYGKGVFWKNVDTSRMELVGSDIDDEKAKDVCADVRCLPYEDSSFDVVVFDPPYSSGWFLETNKKASGDSDYSHFSSSYSSGSEDVGEIHPAAQFARKRHAKVLDIYFRGIEEAKRILKDDGMLILKSQDEVSDNKQYLTHMEVTDFCESLGFHTRDLVVVVRNNKATTTHDSQHAALKRHSYFTVHEFGSSSLRG